MVLTNMTPTPLPALPSVPADVFRRAMRHPANAVAIIATGAPGHRIGLTMTAVCSLSDSPPSVLICVYRESAALAPIRRNGRFSVNFLGTEHAHLAALFAGHGGLRGEERFAQVDWTTLATGSPILASAVASFDCMLDREVESPSHAVLFGRVAAVLTAPDTAQPLQKQGLVYSSGDFGRFAPLGV